MALGTAFAVFALASCKTGDGPKDPNPPVVEAEKFTVTFDPKGAQTIDSQTIEKGKKVTKPSDPQKDGYIFKGWFKETTCQNEWNFETDIVMYNMVLYAKWEKKEDSTPITYTITFHTDGGTAIKNQTINENGKVVQPENPTKKGYQFLGWYEDEEFKIEFNFQKDVLKDLTLYAKWQIETYQVTFESNGGSAVKNQSILYHHEAERPESPTKEGYIFVGWYKDAALTKEFDFINTMIVKDIVLYAKWEEKPEEEDRVKVVFNSKGGSSIPAYENVAVGSMISKPEDPTREGYTFLGWFKDTGGTLKEKFDFDTEIVTESMTLYARWDINSYNVSFHSDGGSEVSSQTVEYGTTAVRPESPTKEGFIFGGWYIDPLKTLEFDFVNDIVLKDMVLYAKWIKDNPTSITVTFNSKGGSEISPITHVVSGSKITKPNNPVREGYTFVGWFKDTGGALVDEFDFDTEVVTESMTLYAKWEEEVKPVITYTVSFEVNGGNPISSLKVEAGKAFSAPTTPIREGYTFIGWFKDSLFQTSYVFSEPVTTNFTLYAKWEKLPVAEEKTIVFDFAKFNGLTVGKLDSNNKTTVPIAMDIFTVGTGVKATASELNTQGKEITIVLSGTVSNSFTLTGTGGSGNSTTSNTTIITLYKVVDGQNVLVKELGRVDYKKSITLTEMDLEAGTYVIKTDRSLKISNFIVTEKSNSIVLNEFLVSFNYQNGTSENIVSVQEGNVVEKPIDPVYEGYIFKGWYTNSLYTTPFDFNTPITFDLILYAKWEEEPLDPNVKAYTVLFITDCDTQLEKKQIQEGKKLPTPASLVKEGYTFAGWYTDSSFQEAYNFDLPVYEDITLYAKWIEQVTYSIQFETNGYADPIEMIQKVTALPELPKLTSSEKSFGGWYYDKELTEKASAGDLLEANVILYAKWNEKSNVEVIRALGDLETAYVEWKPVAEATSYNVYYKKSTEADAKYVSLDKMLIREYPGKYRADVLGLAAGNYTLKVVPVFGTDEFRNGAIEDVTVLAHTRSGFAFAADSPLKTASGAYNDDGTLRAGAQVIYVTAKNAKTVKATVQGNEVSGLQSIIDAKQKAGSTDILDFRIIGEIKRSDLDHISSSAEGLQIKGAKGYQNMNITFEGVGEDATINGFGFLIRNSGNVEMRNFGIINFMDDGISIDTNNCNLWIHNVDFFYGAPGGDSDQAKGDGSLDIKKHSRYITAAYNHFWDSGKCNLQGMKSEATEDYITYHHNWYDHSDSRHPRIRTCSVHVYNNYFDGNSKYGVGITMGGSAFVENNYFRNCNNPMLSSLQGTDALGDGTFSGETGGIIKAYGNYIEGGKEVIYYQSNATSFDAYLASSRDEKLPSSVMTLSGGTTYNNFDTSSTFYSYEVDSPEVARQKVMRYAGRINGGDLKFTFNNEVEDTNYGIIPELKQMVLNYKTTLVRILGES